MTQTNSTLKFHGSLDDLKAILDKIDGHFVTQSQGAYHFKSIGGITLSWWPTTGTCLAQGKKAPTTAYQKKLRHLLREHLSPTPQTSQWLCEQRGLEKTISGNDQRISSSPCREVGSVETLRWSLTEHSGGNRPMEALVQ